MSNLIEDYLREVSASLRVDTTRKRQIIDELRAHLRDKVEDETLQDPSRDPTDVARGVLRDFGNPRDLALAYEPEGRAILRNALTGATVLRFGRAAARGTGKVLKWTAIVLAGLLVVALGVGAWAYYEVKPYIPAMLEQREPTYQYYERCAETPCNGSVPADLFHVSHAARTLRFDLRVSDTYPPGDLSKSVGNGTIRIKVVDPAGAAVYDRTHEVTVDRWSSYEASWEATPGNWSVEYTYDSFVGTVSVEAYALSIPMAADER